MRATRARRWPTSSRPAPPSAWRPTRASTTRTASTASFATSTVDDLNVNLELVRRGAASPYFFDDDRGRYADDLLDAGRDAEEAGRGLWGACPSTRLEPWHAVDTGPAGR